MNQPSYDPTAGFPRWGRFLFRSRFRWVSLAGFFLAAVFAFVGVMHALLGEWPDAATYTMLTGYVLVIEWRVHISYQSGWWSGYSSAYGQLNDDVRAGRIVIDFRGDNNP